MPYQPSSKILVLTICSLHKAGGGTNDYQEQDAIASRLPTRARDTLIENRERIRRLVKRPNEIDWQGVPLAELEFNRSLVQGLDFGGHDEGAQYFPALRR